MLEKPRHRGLDAVIHQGARRRSHRYVSLIRASLPGTLVAMVLAAVIYVALLVLADRRDWANIVFMATGAALIPAIASSLLIIGARRDNPVTIAIAVTVFAASLVISFLSATRIPISFTAILASLPTTLIGVTMANIALVRSLKHSVAILDFAGASDVVERLDGGVKILAADAVHADIHRLLIDPTVHHTPEYASVLARFYLRGVSIETWPAYVEGYTGRVDIDSFDLGDIAYSPSQILYYRLKRTLDILAVLILALPALAVSACLALYIRIVDGGPVIFIQERRGYAGSTFRLFKFRTMYKGDGTRSTSLNDSRILPGCRLVRQLRLDELPQLVNIVRGDMSFIGPRPVSVPVAEALEARIAQYVNRQVLLPGLTGWAQVSQGYAETEDEELIKLAYDLYYLKHVSLDLDIIIAFRTLRTVLMRVGAR